MKRKLPATILLVVFLIIFAVGCNNKNNTGSPSAGEVFVNHTSTAPYHTVTEKLRLGSGVSVSSYDGDNDVFVTQSSMKIESTTITRYGFCSSDENLIDPRYKAVLDIYGDHAIVVATALENGEEKDYIGVVRIRGKYGQYEYGFSYPYAPLITQMNFLNERYISVLGNKNLTEFSSSGYSYATIYDYTSANGLLEVCKVPNVNNYTRFVLNDGYLAVIDTNSVAFYNLFDVDSDGYLVKRHSINFFTESIYSVSNCSTEVYYLGNGWFIASCTYSSIDEFDTYEFTRVDESSDNVYYIAMKSKRISLLSGKSFDCERILMVSNKYTSRTVRGIADSIMVEDNQSVNSWKTPYVLPVLPTSEAVKEGYSIVYYYYYYYNTENMRSWATSFQIFDNQANATVASNMVLPPVYIDEIGLQNADPNFSIALSEVGYHKYPDGTRVSLVNMDEVTGYHNAFVHNGVIIAYQEEITSTEVKMRLGAVRASDGKLVVPFEYDSVSPFFGTYATASKVMERENDTITKQAFYRIGLDGSVTSIPECYQMCNGVYITRNSGGKFGLNANDGTILIPTKCDSVSTTDYMFKDGKTFYTLVATVENGAGVIYALG